MRKISRPIAFIAFTVIFTAPLLVSAQNVYCPNGTVVSDSSLCPRVSSVNDTYLRFYSDLVLTVVNSYFVPILMAVAFIVFLWGIYKAFIWNAASESEKAEGRKFALWGIIGFVIITSLWGIVNIVRGTIIPSTAGSSRPAYPTL